MAVASAPKPDEYRAYVKKRLGALMPVFARAAIGDFSRDVNVPDKEDEFTELYVGLQIMVEVIREQLQELNQLNRELSSTLDAKTTALRAQSEERARLQSILDSVGEGLLVVDAKGILATVNNTALDLLGQSEQALVGKKWTSALKPKDEHGKTIPIRQLPLQKVLSGGRPVSEVRLRFRRADGSGLPVAITATPIKVEGQVIGAVEVFRDISEVLELEQTRQNFVTLASHQLRTPISIVKWYAQMLAQKSGGDLSKLQTKYLDEIINASRRMNDLVRTLLDIAKVQAGEYLVEPAYLDVADVAQLAVKEMRAAAEPKGIKLIGEYKTKLPMVRADPKAIRVAVQNFLSNSLRHTARGGKIFIGASLVTAGSQLGGREIAQNSVVAHVRDTGSGIPKAMQSHIFKRMFSSDYDKGSGLGLYITKTIIEHAGGQIWFSSVPRKGSTFYFAFPVETTDK